MQPMRVAALQLDVQRGDVDANVEAVEAGLGRAASEDVELVGLPEMWPTSFIVDVAQEAEEWLARTNAALAYVRDLSRSLDLAVFGSAFGPGDPAVPGQLPRNRLHVFDRGEEVLAYDKVHLFSLTAEHLAFSGGTTQPPTVEVRGAKLSGAVCYDLRYAPVLRRPYLDEAELLVVPAQWPDTRASHWRALCLGRAVEHQAFVVGVNRTGSIELGKRGRRLEFPGNSLIASPHGRVLAEGKGESGLVVAEVDVEEARRLRRHVPVRADEPRELYRDWQAD
jgi:predicted amidohydrolase